MSIQGFLSDRSLIDSNLPFINLEKLAIPCGYLDRDTIEYFVEPLEISDNRTDRLLITYRREFGVIPVDDDVLTNTMNVVYPMGLAHLQEVPGDTVTLAQYAGLDYVEFANDILPVGPVSISSSRDMKLTIDNANLTDIEKAAIYSMSSAEQSRVFNIIEYITFGSMSSDDASDINDVLVAKTSFTGYVPTSIHLDQPRTIVYLFGGINIYRYVPKYFSFDFVIGTKIIRFKIWIDKVAFRTLYPVTNIINIVPPMRLEMLLDPSPMLDPIASAIDSKAWSDAIIKPELVNRDQSGMYTFDTRYIYNNKTYHVTFSIIYRGKTPDSLEARVYIASYLLASGIGTRALWELLLPDVFYHSAFALIPFYDNLTELTNADVYPSIIDATGILPKISSVLATLPHATDPVRELMTAAYDRYFIGVAPADVNQISRLLEIHPTYRDFSTTDTGFNEMSAEDREWSVKLNQALSVAAGETNALTVNRVIAGELEWINFVMSNVSYLILTIESYKAHFNVE